VQKGDQGTVTEGEGSVQFAVACFVKKNIIFFLNLLSQFDQKYPIETC